ncbi:hypothetical protein BOX17_11665 [Halomonas aestuarii]|uniref:Uncharacterized protein n=2 Tax=Halomonas aestuarii TaxID=1897729 RepID=A0A1J0VHP5_9GAMM|nr:hypothetical protein BOX17_11665 [Halomonas aestuarii]
MQSNLYDPHYSEIEPTTDTSLDCPWSYVTDNNGDSFCYTGEDANTGGAEYPDTSTRVDHYDGSYTITEPDGTTTEYNADGGLKSPTSAPTTADGQEYGDDADGIIKAISSLKNAVNDGFDGIVDKFSDYVDDTVKSIADQGPTGDNIEDVGTPEENLSKATGALEGAKDNLMSRIDGTDSEFGSLYATMQGYWSSFFPSIPEPACSPLVFAQGTPYSFTIQCDVFDMIREALAWILYALTLYVIIATMFSARPS